MGSLSAIQDEVLEAERGLCTTAAWGRPAQTSGRSPPWPYRALETGERTHGVITVAKRDRPFNDDDRDLLRSLASQATLALENVQLHHQVQRQAVTDELTGLTNHGRFQELLCLEAEQVRRYHHPFALIMLDIDDFKSINDNSRASAGRFRAQAGRPGGRRQLA